MVSDVEVCMKQRCVLEFLHMGKMAPSGINRHLLNVFGGRTVDVRTVRQWVVRFSSGDSNSADFYEHSRKDLIHHWWKCIANGGEYVEK